MPSKGRAFDTYDNLMKIICDDLDSMGYDKVCFRSDGENPIGAVLGDIKNRWRGHAVIPEKAAEGDHQSNGGAECGHLLVQVYPRSVPRPNKGLGPSGLS